MAQLEVENEQLEFLKTIRPYDADKQSTAADAQPAVGGGESAAGAGGDNSMSAVNTTLDDLGFPEEDNNNEGVWAVLSSLRASTEVQAAGGMLDFDGASATYSLHTSVVALKLGSFGGNY